MTTKNIRVDTEIEWRAGEMTGTSRVGLWQPLPYSFAETVARLITVSGQYPIYDGYKSSVNFWGRYRGQQFTIYDWKGEDDNLHIGGRTTMTDQMFKELIVALTLELVDVEPHAYHASASYHGPKFLDSGELNEDYIYHQWPADATWCAE